MRAGEIWKISLAPFASSTRSADPSMCANA
jgi:hypothetical protein